MNNKNKNRGGAPYLIILVIITAIILGAALFSLGLWFGGNGTGKEGTGGNGSGGDLPPQTPIDKPPQPATSSKTNSEFIVVIDKSTYIMPGGERLEDVEQLINNIKTLDKPNLIINAKQSSIQGSHQTKKALDKAGLTYKWEE